MSRSSLLPSSTGTKPESKSFTSAPSARATHSLRHRITHRLAPPLRWLHIYLSMLGLSAILFFSVTGFTLNHPDWFGDAQRRTSAEGQVEPQWLKNPARANTANVGDAGSAQSVDKLQIVEYLRQAHRIHAALSEFRVE